jgi:hypothetical protein
MTLARRLRVPAEHARAGAALDTFMLNVSGTPGEIVGYVRMGG